MPNIELYFVATFCGLMVAAGMQDLLTFKISHKIIIGLILMFLPYAYFSELTWTDFVYRWLALLIITPPLLYTFHRGWMAGGDVKLLMAGSLWYAPYEETMLFLAFCSFFGGIWTLAIQGMKIMPMPVFLLNYTWYNQLIGNKTSIPYGVGIAIGAVLTQLTFQLSI